MKYVLKSDEMKACDNYTISRIGILSMVLMERAALSVVRVLEERNIQFSQSIYCANLPAKKI